MKQQTNNKHLHIASFTLSHRDFTLQQISTHVGLSTSQIGLYLSSVGIKKKKGTKGLWIQTNDFKQTSKATGKKRGRPSIYDDEIRQLKRIYDGMITRCSNPKHISYKNYGARGISVSSRWLGPDGFFNFAADMGSCPEGLTLEREDNNLGYAKENCHWASWVTQANNRRPKTKLSVGKTTSIELARQMRSDFKQGFYTRHQLAEKYRTSAAMVSHILNNRIWKE